MGALRPGDVLRDNKNRKLVVVDKFQKNQTRGYWVTGDTLETIQTWLGEDSWDYVSWWISQNYPDRTFPAAFPGENPTLCLCLDSELDPPEINEWGMVSP